MIEIESSKRREAPDLGPGSEAPIAPHRAARTRRTAWGGITSPMHWLGARLPLCAALLTGCSDTATFIGDDAGGAGGQGADSARVVLGTGEAEFEGLADGEVLTAAAGPQGGMHVWVSFLSYGFEGDRFSFVLEKAQGSQPQRADSGKLRVRASIDGEGRLVQSFAGWPAQLDQPRCADGQSLDLTLTIRDEAGHAASDTRHVQIAIPETYRSMDCNP